jgi:protein involved in polysaccharide export with SLBB domain
MRLLRVAAARFAAAVVICSFLAACAGDRIVTAPSKDHGDRALAHAIAATAEYRLAPGDQLRVTIFDVTTQTSEHTLDANGAVAVAPIQPLPVKQMTAKEAGTAISRALTEAGFYQKADVTVDVLAYGKFYVLGEVEDPGEFAYRPGMSLFAALASAGGHTYRANRTRVFIRRATDTIETEYELTSDLAIWSGDVIRVPEVRL